MTFTWRKGEENKIGLYCERMRMLIPFVWAITHFETRFRSYITITCESVTWLKFGCRLSRLGWDSLSLDNCEPRSGGVKNSCNFCERHHKLFALIYFFCSNTSDNYMLPKGVSFLHMSSRSRFLKKIDAVSCHRWITESILNVTIIVRRKWLALPQFLNNFWTSLQVLLKYSKISKLLLL